MIIKDGANQDQANERRGVKSNWNSCNAFCKGWSRFIWNLRKKRWNCKETSHYLLW